MKIFAAWNIILPAAFILDMIFGDPQSDYHPIRYMGKAVTALEPHFLGRVKRSETRRSLKMIIAGGVFALSLILATWAVTWTAVSLSEKIHPFLGTCLQIGLIYFCISARCLEESAMRVYKALKQNDLQEAKQSLAMIVGRDVENLSEQGVTRAAVETVAENLVDGVISPLFFAALGGAPLAMAYKMVNTLDSMIGYKNEKYMDFGKIAARTDDVANFIPARLSVPLISIAAHLLLGKGKGAWNTAIREGRNHSSPNSGYSEAAFAGALEVKLGGPNYYGGQLVSKPYIGESFGETDTEHIRTACRLMIFSSFLWLLILEGLTIITH